MTPGFRRLRTATRCHRAHCWTPARGGSDRLAAVDAAPEGERYGELRINGGKASNKGVAKSKVKVLEVTSHGGKRVVEHVELPKLPKGYERLLHRARGAPSR